MEEEKKETENPKVYFIKPNDCTLKVKFEFNIQEKKEDNREE